ncbi:mucin-7-like [Eriocheir sinensis]|uniref:mucin-7-like n=1 Tax=Eriocheir sinensis TaxID=95602 RepID=UPI0021C8585D|nr:mucin-7-like [Eriocheir sinensis]
MQRSKWLYHLSLACLTCPGLDSSHLDTQVTKPQPFPEPVSTVPCDPARQAASVEDHRQGECPQEEALPLSPALLTVQECMVVPLDDAGAQPPCVPSIAAGAGAREKGDLEPSALLTVPQEVRLELEVIDVGQLATVSPSTASVPTASCEKPPDIDVKVSLASASAPPDAGQLPPASPLLASVPTASHKKPPDIDVKASLGSASAPDARQLPTSSPSSASALMASRKKPPDIDVKASLGSAASPPRRKDSRTAKLSRLRLGLGDNSDVNIMMKNTLENSSAPVLSMGAPYWSLRNGLIPMAAA